MHCLYKHHVATIHNRYDLLVSIGMNGTQVIVLTNLAANKTILEIVGSITNAYNRNNIFYVNRVTSEEIYQFPLLPSFGMSYKF